LGRELFSNEGCKRVLIGKTQFPHFTKITQSYLFNLSQKIKKIPLKILFW
jgi:hypothetical protein